MPTWDEYEAGAPREIKESLAALGEEVVRLRTMIARVIPQEPQDSGEMPEETPQWENTNYKAKILIVESDGNGKYRGTALQALEDYPKNRKKGETIVLRSKKWEDDFKRAQGTNPSHLICLRMSGDGKVQGVGLLD